MNKPWYKSKTMLVNIGLAIVSVGVALQDTALITEHPQVVAVIGAVVGAVNMVLRYVTDQPIGK
jgi:hypothetical protein